jgi:hypothetical protein
VSMALLRSDRIQTRKARRVRAERLGAGAVLLFAALWSMPAWGQSAVWLPQGATGNIYYNGGNVGIGTTNLLKTAGIALVDRRVA